MSINTRKIAKNTGTIAGIIGMAVLMGAGAAAQVQAETARPRAFRAHWSDADDIWALDIENDEGSHLSLVYTYDGFYVGDSNIKGCKPMRAVDVLNEDLVSAFKRNTRNTYIREANQDVSLYLSSFLTRSPLLFRRETKDGDMVDTFLRGPWSAKAVCL